MFRRFAILATTLSFLLCMGLCTVWARSYSASEQLGVCYHVRFTPGNQDARGTYWLSYSTYDTFTMISDNGGITLETGFGGGPGRVPSWRPHVRRGAGPRPRFFRFGTGTIGAHHLWGFQTIYPVPVAALLLLPAIRVARLFRKWMRRRRLISSGCCTVCGYDMHVTPDRCPECGTAAAI